MVPDLRYLPRVDQKKKKGLMGRNTRVARENWTKIACSQNSDSFLTLMQRSFTLIINKRRG